MSGSGRIETETRAVLFADLGGSTRLYERLGDIRAHEIATGCLSRLEDVVDEFGGRIIKHIGDELMCVFPAANDAVSAACRMQEQVTAPADELDLTIHIGLHCGPVLVEKGDVFGDAVNLAARIASLARARQILTTAATVQMLEPTLHALTRLIDRRHVKGKQADVDVYEIVWEQTEERTEFIGLEPSPPTVTELRIAMGLVELRAGEDNPSVTLGRDSSNDLVLQDQVASRHHAKIARRANRWVLTDHSINGTVVAADDGVSAFVHNEQILLPDAGWLGIGNPPREMSVRFELVRVPR